MTIRSGAFATVTCILVIAATGLSGCDQFAGYDTPGFGFSATYRDRAESPPVLLDNVAWWEGFKDPTLDALIEQGLSASLDLDLARERIVEARALRASVAGGMSVSGDATAAMGGDDSGASRNASEAAIGLGWLFDIYGERRARAAAANAQIEVADAELNAARLALLSQITISYVDLRYYERALTLRRKQLRSRQDTSRIVQDFIERGVGTKLDMVRANALISETQAQIPTLQAAIRLEQNRLSTLLGRQAGSDAQKLVGSGGRQPQPAMSADVGIPADLLRNRPDIRVRERLYFAAIQSVAAARADLYPQLSLNGTISLDSDPGGTAASYLIGPTLRLPSLPDGPRRAAVAVQQSRARQAQTEWRQTVLGAIEEVEGALVRYSASREGTAASQRTVNSYEEAVELTKTLIGQGDSTLRDLLDAEQQVAQAEIGLAQNLRENARDFVALNVSLGSGNARQAARP